jgi:hypothetical protein
MGLGELLGREPADQRLGEVAGLQALEIAADLVDQAEADLEPPGCDLKYDFYIILPLLM